jgi:hypothetical protein
MQIMREAPEFVYATYGSRVRAPGAPPMSHSRIQIAPLSGDVE